VTRQADSENGDTRWVSMSIGSSRLDLRAMRRASHKGDEGRCTTEKRKAKAEDEGRSEK
jgi:hypothetical protein